MTQCLGYLSGLHQADRSSETADFSAIVGNEFFAICFERIYTSAQQLVCPFAILAFSAERKPRELRNGDSVLRGAQG